MDLCNKVKRTCYKGINFEFKCGLYKEHLGPCDQKVLSFDHSEMLVALWSKLEVLEQSLELIIKKVSHE
jgi:hypothetical protein